MQALKLIVSSKYIPTQNPHCILLTRLFSLASTPWSIYGNDSTANPIPDYQSKGSDNIGSKYVRNVKPFGGFKDIVRNKKPKSKNNWVCENCGYSDGQWWGTCRLCNSVCTMKHSSQGDSSGSTGIEGFQTKLRSWKQNKPVEANPVRLVEVNKGIDHSEWRIRLPGHLGNEITRVLGGGIVPGSLVLFGGDPGVGKSTLLLQIAGLIAEKSVLDTAAPVLYVSGEESLEQIGNRADRMKIDAKEIILYSSTDVEDVIEKIQLVSPRAIIVDSIQTVYLKEITGSAGGTTQVKECTLALLCLAKKTNIPVLLIGHLTKTGEIAGPRILEHIVDVVLYLEISAEGFLFWYLT